MRIFISYSTEDIELVRWLAGEIRCHAQVDFWDESKVLGEGSWDTICNLIDLSDLVIAIVTDHTVRRGIAVGNEIGYAKKANKPIIPLVGEAVPESALGCLSGVSYQRMTLDNFEEVLRNLKGAVIEKKRQMRNTAIFVFGGIVAALLLGGSGDTDEDDDED